MPERKPYRLVARKNGSSASERGRGFNCLMDVGRAVVRWQAQGFTWFWFYGTPDINGDRSLLTQGPGPEVTAAVVNA